MMNSLAASTVKQYNGSFRLWWQFCQNRKISPFSGSISDILTFFQSLLVSTNNAYGTFNSHHAAISLIVSTDEGNDSQIKRFMKGVCRKRPPKPKYNSIWNPQQVLTYLEETTDSNLKMLSHK